jgi:hypothetical protein
MLICRDKVQLHFLRDDPPSDATKLDEATLDSPVGDRVVGFEVKGTTLTGFVDGKQVVQATNGDIKKGKVDAGGVKDGDNPADVTFSGFRVFSPPVQANPQPNPTRKHASPTPSSTPSTTETTPSYLPTPTA